MSLVCLAFLVVVTSGYKQANNQSIYQNQANNQSINQNGNQQIYPIENIHGQQNQRRNPYQSNNQRQITNQQIQPNDLPSTTISPRDTRHCLMVNTSFKCTPGRGRRVFNSGIVWDPNQEQDAGVDETWDCTPCCKLPNKTIELCNSNIRGGSNNRRQNNNRQANQRLNQGRRNQINNQQAQSRNHCQMVNTHFQCSPGPGRRIYNSGTVWNPSLEQDAGVDDSWNCTACCQFQWKTIPQCDQRMGQITPISGRNHEEDCQNAETNGSDYDGNVSTTNSGLTCQNWSIQSPHEHMYDMEGNHNFCRNPSRHPSGVWCYTTDPTKRWENCNVSICA